MREYEVFYTMYSNSTTKKSCACRLLIPSTFTEEQLNKSLGCRNEVKTICDSIAKLNGYDLAEVSEVVEYECDDD